MEGYGVAVHVGGIELHVDGRLRVLEPWGLEFRSPFGRPGGPRGRITGFSNNSKRRLAWALANARVKFAGLVTLTYHARVDESDGDQAATRNRALVKRSKADLNRVLSCLRGEMGAYVWIQEFQSRGAVHFHVLTERTIDERRLASAWCAAADQLHDPHALKHSVKVRAIKDQVAARRCLVKYFGKAVQKRLPAGVERAGRFWGGSRALVGEALRVVSSCEQGGLDHMRAPLCVTRGVRRFVSGVVRFKWRGGKLPCWRPELPQRVLRVVEQLSQFYGVVSVPERAVGMGRGEGE